MRQVPTQAAGSMTDLDPAPGCPGHTTFYAVRAGGWVWEACRRCGAAQIRRPLKEHEA